MMKKPVNEIHAVVLQLMLAQTNCLLIAFDKNGRETYISDASESLFGYTANEVACITVMEMLDSDSKTYFRESMQTLIGKKCKEAAYVELLFKHKNQKQVLLAGHMFYAGNASKQACVYLLLCDIGWYRQKEKKPFHDPYIQRSILRQQVKAREEERKAIAASLHDDIGQLLTAFKLELGWMNANLDKPAECRKKIGRLSKQLDETVIKTQRLSYELRPVLPEKLDITSAIKKYCVDWKEQAGINIHLSIDTFILNKEVSLAVFRIIQEALTNVARHAQAKSVHIKLTHSGNLMHLVIEDDGIGISEQKIEHIHSYGIMGMKERAEICNGKLLISGNKGTKIELVVPFI